MRTINRTGPLDAEVPVPGSKSITQRALMAAALARGTSVIENPLISEDTVILTEALRLLGVDVVNDGRNFVVTGRGPNIENPGEALFLGNNGTALRFLITMVCLGRGTFVLDGNRRLRERPIQPLTAALETLGVACCGTASLPVVIEGAGILPGGTVRFKDLDSSQYVSSILLAAPYASRDMEIQLRGSSVSLPYIDMTIDVMNRFGVTVRREGASRYTVPVPQRYHPGTYATEGDVSSASYFLLAGMLTGGRVRVTNLNPRGIQGDRGFFAILQTLGADLTEGDTWIEITGKALKEGTFRFDMKDMPDLVPTLAVLAAYRPGTTVIDNVSHLRKKESDRIRALCNELTRIGIDAKERADGLIIQGGRPQGAEIETYDDHRIAMSFAVAGLVTGGIHIQNEACVAKSFPGFWNELEKLAR